MDFYYVFGGIKRYNYSYVRSSDTSIKNAIKGQVQDMWFKRGDEGKKYHSPYYSSSALASLTLYPNTETVGKSDYLKLSMVSLRYRVPHAFLEKNIRFIQYANVAFQASNLFMICLLYTSFVCFDIVTVDGEIPFCRYLTFMFLSDFYSCCFAFG